MKKATQDFVGRLGQLKFRPLHSHCLTLWLLAVELRKKKDDIFYILPDVPYCEKKNWYSWNKLKASQAEEMADVTYG